MKINIAITSHLS